VFEIKVIIIDHSLRDSLRTQLYKSKNAPSAKPTLPARPKPSANIPYKQAKAEEPSSLLIDLSEKVEQDLLLSDGISKNPFIQPTQMLDTWQPLQPSHAQPGIGNAHSLNPFINE
jgi:hypothetical protein